jgi:fumarate hydratase class II
MVCARVVGNDSCLSYSAALGSNFELNVMMPVMAEAILESVTLLAKGSVNFADKCVKGIVANEERLHQLAEASIATCTALVPKLGYDKSAELAKTAFKTGKALRQVALEDSGLSKEELDSLLDLLSMTEPGL